MMFRRDGQNFLLEFSALNALRQGITAGITVTASIRKSTLYWDDTPDTFSSAGEVQLTLAHVINGFYRFTSNGGAEFLTQSYEIHLTVTGNPNVNENSTFTETIIGFTSLEEAYPDGCIYFDSTITANTNTVLTQDGTFLNPVTSYASARTLAENLGTRKICVKAGIFKPIGGGGNELTGFEVVGLGYWNTFDTSGNTEIINTTIKNMTVTNTGSIAGGANATFKDCNVPSGHIHGAGAVNYIRCILGGGDYGSNSVTNIIDCVGRLGGTVNLLGFSSGHVVNVERFAGNIDMSSFTTAGKQHAINLLGGHIGLSSSNTQSEIILTGIGTHTDNTGASVIVTTDQGWFDTEASSGGDATLANQSTIISNQALQALDATVSTLSAQSAIQSDITSIKAITDNLPESIKKNTALSDFPFGLVLSSDDVSPALGVSPVTAERSIDNGAFETMSNVPTELTNGDYRIDLSADDTNGTFITYKFSGATARTKKIRFKTAL